MAYAPRVSIGLAVYNSERFLPATLDSIMAQTFEDFELIISDNASTDSTAEVCREYAARDPRIKYSRNPVNIGLYPNYNRAFRLSSGEYFRWSAADDLFAPTSLQACVEILDQHPEVALCYPKTTLIDGDGKFLRYYDDNLDVRLPAPHERFRLVLARIRLVNAPYGLMRTDVLRRTSLFGTYPGADMVFLAELALYGQFWEIPQQLFYRRMHEGNWKPETKRSLDLYFWRHRLHNLVSILCAPIGPVEKVRGLSVVGGYVFHSRQVYFRELQSAGVHLLRKTSGNQENI